MMTTDINVAFIVSRARSRMVASGRIIRAGGGDGPEVPTVVDVGTELPDGVGGAVVDVGAHRQRTLVADLTGRTAGTRKRLASAREEIDRLAALVDDLLVLARADSDHLDAFESIGLATLLTTVGDRFAPLAARQQLALTVEASGTTHADARGLDRALANLTDNALRHTPAGGQVHLHARVERGVAHLTVTDTGPGVAPDDLDTLFDRFSRTDAARTSGGAGLGLAIVDSVARAHHGTVTARNRTAGGLRIDLTLPGGPPDGLPSPTADADDR